MSISLCPRPSSADYSREAISNGAAMRIVSLPADGQGRIEALLDIKLKSEWITYWREPGAAGIPPQISISDASIGTIGNIRYPVPKKIMLGQFLDIAYDKPVQIPFSISLNDPTRKEPFNLSVLIGVCKDICIPFAHEFSVDPQAGQHTVASTQMVTSAHAKLPEAPSDDFKVDSFKINDNRRTVDLTLTVPDGTKEITQVIIAGPSGHAYTLVNEVQMTGTKAHLNVDAVSLPKDYVEAGKTWTAVFTLVEKSGERSMETELQFPAP